MLIMKKIIRKISPAWMAIVFFSSCTKYLDINENPNAATEPPIAGLLAHVTNASAYTTFKVSNITSYYVQYLASPTKGNDLDTYNATDESSTWSFNYDVLTDLYQMRKFAITKNLGAYKGIADILTAYNLQLTLNLWGNIPYSEAFQGATNFTPKVDDQKSLYDTCIALLDRGITELSDPAVDGQLTAESDFIHGGDNKAWVKTAWLLKARLLNEITKQTNYDPAAVIAALANSYGSNDDDAQVKLFDGSGPWTQVAINNALLLLDGWLSAYFVGVTNDSLYGYYDPRLPVIASKTADGFYRGTQNGAGHTGSTTDNGQSVLPEDGWYSAPGAPFLIATYAEAKFMESEAQFRLGNKTEAYDAYLAGITANMQKLNLADTSIMRYTTLPSVAVGSGNLTLALIMKEKYIACFLMPVTWDDMRRLDYAYKQFQLPANANLNEFIRRIDYPTIEYSTNLKNLPTVSLTDHMWWDQ
jgi:hypothetical protein